MEIHPPIKDRTTEQLLDIIETEEEWRPEVIDSVKQELIKRGIPTQTLEIRKTIRTKFNERIRKTKERSTYTSIEKVLIVLTGPLLVIFFRDILFFYSEGYKRKNKQGWFYLLLGFTLWGLGLYLYFKIARR